MIAAEILKRGRVQIEYKITGRRMNEIFHEKRRKRKEQCPLRVH